MKIMILYDSHSMTKQTLLNFINQHPADYYIHCGDIYMPYSPLEIASAISIIAGIYIVPKTFRGYSTPKE